MTSGSKPRRILHPSTTAAILLGGYDFSTSGIGKRQSERMAGADVRNWLYGKPAELGLGLDRRLDLFASPLSATDQFSVIQTRLGALLKEAEKAKLPIEDVLVYYIGHGIASDEGGLSLLLEASRQDTQFVTGIRTADLAEVLRKVAGKQRRHLILDCCFADKAAPDLFIGPVAGAWASRIAEGDEEAVLRGTLLLCASSRRIKALAPKDMDTTLFTGAFLDAVCKGSGAMPAHMSFADVRALCVNFVEAKMGKGAPLPVLHAPDQSMGDLSAAPAFENWAVLPLPPVEEPSATDLLQAGLQQEAEDFPALAARFYRKAIGLGAVDAMTRLGALLQEGADGVDRDEHEAFRLLNEALEAGDLEAMIRVAYMRHRGVTSWGFPPNPGIMSKLIQKAAARGFADAQSQLGQAYRGWFELDGIPYDLEKALDWLSKAAEQGHRLALLQYGRLLLELAADKADADKESRAKSCLLRAKTGGTPSLWWRLFKLHMSTEIGNDAFFAEQADERIAEFDDRLLGGEAKSQRQYIRRALRNPDHYRFYLAQCYETGHYFLAEDREKAFQLYEEAARSGSGDLNEFGRTLSRYKTAIAYETGLFGRRASRIEAERWFRKAKESVFWIRDYVFYEGLHKGLKLEDLIDEGLRRIADDAPLKGDEV